MPFLFARYNQTTVCITLLTALCLSACNPTPSEQFKLGDDTQLCGVFHPSMPLAFAAGIKTGGQIWPIPPNQSQGLLTVNHSNTGSVISNCKFSQNGHFLLTSTQNELVLWGIQSKKIKALGKWSAPHKILSIDVSNTGKHILVGMKDHFGWLINTQNNQTEMTVMMASGVSAVAFSPDEQQVALGSAQGELTFWSLATQEKLHQSQFNTGIEMILFGPKAKQVLITAEYGQNVLLDLTNGYEDTKSLGGTKQRIVAAQFTPNNELLTAYTTRTIQAWQLPDLSKGQTYQTSQTFQWRSAGKTILGLKADKQHIWALYSNGDINKWDISNP